MTKVILICGKICSGKSYYANQLKTKENAVILSCDEITSALFDNDLGDKHEAMTEKIREYLLKKSIDIFNTGTTVILDWGFWSKDSRTNAKQFFISKNIPHELHFINIDDNSWQKNISQRNKKILDGDDKINYFVDEGLLKKLIARWQQPTKSEVDIWLDIKR